MPLTARESQSCAWSVSTSHSSGDDALLAILNTFHVPFAVFDRSGTCRQVSSAASRVLLGMEPAYKEALWRQASKLVDGKLGSTRREGGQPARLALPAVGCDVSVHPQFRHGSLESIVVVFHPAPPVRDVSASLDEYELTPREGEVARLLAGNRTAKEVALALGISQHTARHHTERVFAKLGVQSRGQLMLLVGAQGE